jgi:hypothetical protein
VFIPVKPRRDGRIIATQFNRPYGTVVRTRPQAPAINRWAIVKRPCGSRFLRSVHFPRERQMAWIGKSQGLFRLHSSDEHCGSFLTIDDAAEILDVPPAALEALPTRDLDGEVLINELDLHRSWGAGKLKSPNKPKQGNVARSFDELIVRELLQITLSDCQVECQIPFGRNRVDLRFSHGGRSILVEFVGPSHFIPQYQRGPTSPLARKREVEDHFGCECIIWPFWIQRCSRNVLAITDKTTDGLASVWSTKALFGDFVFPRSAQIILDLSGQFRAIRPDGLGYMYGNAHTTKPVHPIIEAIRRGVEDKSRLIPKGNDKPESFWMPPP